MSPEEFIRGIPRWDAAPAEWAAWRARHPATELADELAEAHAFRERGYR